MIEIVEHPRVESFHRAAFEHLCQNEAQNCWVIGLVCSLLVEPDKVSVRFWTVEEDDHLLGAAWLNQQELLGFSPLPARAGRPLANVLDERKLQPSGVAGPQEICDAFCAAWTSTQNATIKQTICQRVHQLEKVKSLPSTVGSMQAATPAQRPLLLEWEKNFGVDCHIELTDEQIQQSVDEALVKSSRYLWMVDGTPRSMAEHRGETPSGVRISYVFTPQEFRGRGYASALVAQLSQKMLDSGKRFCFLYTDVANPTSNRIYHKIGYHPACDAIHHLFKYESG